MKTILFEEFEEKRIAFGNAQSKMNKLSDKIIFDANTPAEKMIQKLSHQISLYLPLNQ